MNIAGDTGLTVVDLRIADGDDQPPAEIWRLQLDDFMQRLPEARPLSVFVDTVPRNRRAFWTIGQDLVFVRKNADYVPPWSGSSQLLSTKTCDSWSYRWNDYSEVLLVVLPEGTTCTNGSPPPRASLRGGGNGRGRLVLWFSRPGREKNWTATWQIRSLDDWGQARREAARLNDVHWEALNISNEAKGRVSDEPEGSKKYVINIQNGHGLQIGDYNGQQNVFPDDKQSR
jgi:hypothetical protein